MKGSSAKSGQSTTPLYFLTSRNAHGNAVTLFVCQNTIQLWPAPQPVQGEKEPQHEAVTQEDRIERETAREMEGEREGEKEG